MSRQILASGEKLVVTRPDAISSLNTFTWACWLYPNGGFGASTPGVLSKLNDAGTERKKLRITGASLARRFIGEVSRATTGAFTTSVTGTIVIGAWQHLAMTYTEAEGARLYRDGVEVVYSTRTIGVGATEPDGDGSFVIGGMAVTLDGRVAEVGIWNRVLTGAELSVLSERRYSPVLVRSGLLAAWRLLGATPEPDALGGPAAVPSGTAPAEHPASIISALPERSTLLGMMRGQCRGMG